MTKNVSAAVLIFILLFAIALQLVSAFNGVKPQIFIGDEIAWVYDSYIYQLRVDRDQRMYVYDKSYLEGAWADIKTRIVDQPQFGKFLYGFLLKFQLNFDYQDSPPLFDASSEKYSRFGYYSGELSGQNLNEISQELGGAKWVDAIISMRYVSFTFFVLILIVHGFFIWFLTNDLVISLVSVGLLSINKLFLFFSQVATMDLPSLFFMYVSVIVFFYAQKNQVKRTNVRRILFSISGSLGAVAATTKLNGFFLIFLPILFLNRHKMKLWVADTILFFVGFVAMFGIVEIAVLNKFESLLVLLFARLQQQSFFLLTYDSLNPFEYLLFVVQSVFENYGVIISALLGLLLIQCVVVFKRKFIISGNLNLRPFQKSVGLFILFFIATNYYYARIGFERYLMIIHVLLVIMATYSLYTIKRMRNL